MLTPPPKKLGIDAGRLGVQPRMEDCVIEKMASDDSKAIAKMLNELGEFVHRSVQSLQLSYSASASPIGSPNFETAWKCHMKYYLLPALDYNYVIAITLLYIAIQRIYILVHLMQSVSFDMSGDVVVGVPGFQCGSIYIILLCS
jgi:hypothetical protein